MFQTVILLGVYFTSVFTKEIFFSDSKRAVEFNQNGDECSIHGDSEYIKKLYMDAEVGVHIVNNQMMEELILECDDSNKNLTVEEHQAKVRRKKRNIIYPGTKWCGTGNIARNFDDLGEAVQTDMCCREHDQCEISIAPFASQYGLTNFAPWYKNHCTCDDNFNICLKNVQNEATADSVGNTFFNFLASQCIQETGNTVRSCVRRRWFWCTRYESQPEMEYREAQPFCP